MGTAAAALSEYVTAHPTDGIVATTLSGYVTANPTDGTAAATLGGYDYSATATPTSSFVTTSAVATSAQRKLLPFSHFPP
jgi:hypothetical protein